MIKVNNLSYSFPQKNLYNNISFTLEDGQHCAFIGTNGSGKSTLIDIIMDPEKYLFDGSLEIEPNCRIGYVRQFQELDKTKEITVFEYLAEDFLKLQNEITSICTEMETSSDIDTLLEKYQQALDAFEAINGDDFENIIDKKLNLIELIKYKDLMISELSGGEFKLIQVIKAMLNSPDLLIMDEPDVFLDFKNLNALKNLINSHKGTTLVITHNRYLLNHCFNKIIHLENMELQEFDGGYIEYNFSLLQTKIELQELAAADTEEIERNEVLIDRLRELATENAEQFRGKTLRARVKIKERLEERRIKAPFVEIKEPNIIFVTANEIEEKTVLKVNDFNLAFDEVLLENVNFEIKSTDKVAIVGSNGTGKTTLFQKIFKNDDDSIEIDKDIKVGYLSQLQGQTLNYSNTIYDEFFDIGFKTRDDIKEYLEGYNFDEEVLNQKIGTLSGGEKNLLQLAKISEVGADLLLLDEPTSHLDTYSQLALEKAIKRYKGAILMVSHDYYTITNCMDYVLLIQNKKIKKISIQQFKDIIYVNHFDKHYLKNEEKKKLLETKIELALRDNNFILAKDLSEELEAIVKLL
ncbi:ABC-F family ATP-binding cassette domain-containing protein [Clostridium sp. NSJ-49]|uniref:ABC-F family ATP-binding cassette domain-containing protein n=1 Tax=Clostridium sp. NSJ-49 TaxID=2763034 RepID=UPI00164B129D|nr:ATP-binding cassette domain-containing protein [Clostridium sp. NSJ-49]MBC5626281.1 ABC-F family ATP-binding cassette domain-containing protein [Clostridium sp. NSJ-49]MDU6340325.1 ATP-binding cassette domain-containing protein [Clostridium sp.]